MAESNLTRLDYIRIAENGVFIVQFNEGGESVAFKRGMPPSTVAWALRDLAARLERRDGSPSREDSGACKVCGRAACDRSACGNG